MRRCKVRFVFFFLYFQLGGRNDDFVLQNLNLSNTLLTTSNAIYKVILHVSYKENKNVTLLFKYL